MKLLERGDELLGIDNHNDYYDPNLKKSRVKRLLKYKNYKHFKLDIANKKSVNSIFKNFRPKKVINLAAQAGVRYSIQNPLAYINSNVVGFINILENCRLYKIKHLVYASTSSVYGANTKKCLFQNMIAPIIRYLFTASKKSNELMAHSYSYLYNIPTTGLRFFTVYGPWGRPDMALFKFTKNIIDEKPIDVFNEGKHTRDFTYIDDIVNGVIKVLDIPATSNSNWNGDIPDNATSMAPWRIYNIGNNQPIKLMKYIDALEKALNKKAKIFFYPYSLETY